MTKLIAVAVGLMLMSAGKKLFRLLIVVAGFAVGAEFAARIFDGSGEFLVYASSAAMGAAGAFLALYAAHLALITAGFLAGGYAVVFIGNEVLGNACSIGSAEIINGTAAGGIMALFLFVPVLMMISSAGGAALLVFYSGIPTPKKFPVLAALFAAGLVFQIGPSEKKQRNRLMVVIAALAAGIYIPNAVFTGSHSQKAYYTAGISEKLPERGQECSIRP